MWHDMRTIVYHHSIGTVAGLLEGREGWHLLIAHVGSERTLHGGCSLKPAATRGGCRRGRTGGPGDGGQGVMLRPTAS